MRSSPAIIGWAPTPARPWRQTLLSNCLGGRFGWKLAMPSKLKPRDAGALMGSQICIYADVTAVATQVDFDTWTGAQGHGGRSKGLPKQQQLHAREDALAGRGQATVR